MRIATPMIPAARLIEIGDRRVTLDACLGKGSMAHVYRATLEAAFGVTRPVACKVFGIVATEDQDAVFATLASAVRRAAYVRHPNVAQVHELGLTAGQQPFIVSELVDGPTLRYFIDALAKQGRRVPLDLALFIGAEMAEGVSGARSAKGPDGAELRMAHLDLSPRDVLLSWQGEVKVTDFELASLRQAASTVRSLSKLARRADTMAPEVARGAVGDARSDVFSMGIVLREMLIGPRFAKGTSDSEALRCARDGFVQGLTFEPHLPDDLRHIVDRALAVDPDQRFPHAGAMAYELRRVALGLGVGDARIFLKTTLTKELGDEQTDATLSQVVKKRRRRESRDPL